MSESYPVRVSAVPPEQPSRALWLVKWLLLIPHAVVLFFLWIAFAALTVVAFFSILFTGRYPRSIFEFNLGVLRWSWRVWFYGYYALGTDRYPPFTLHEVPDYPAGLEIDPPGELSRGLVLVKSWLLAIPHYLVISFFAGGGLHLVRHGADRDWTWGGGLIVLLTLFAALSVLFTGRYPRPIFDLVLGMDRWVLRVVAYAALMTDQYPPFRLDLGGQEGVPPGDPGVPDAPMGTTAAPVAAPVVATTAGPGRSGWTAGRIIALMAGSVAVLIALVAGAGAGLLSVVDDGMRDSHGYLMSGSERFDSNNGYAVTSEGLNLHVHHSAGSMPRRMIGRVKITAKPVGGKSLFIGIARTDEVSDYLRGVAHTVVVDLVDQDGHLVPEYREVDGLAPTTPPAAAQIWAAQVSGPGPLVLRWEPEGGSWTVVVMNADGSASVSAEMTAGATLPLLGWGVFGLLVLALVFLLPGVALLVVAVHRAHRPTSPGAAS